MGLLGLILVVVGVVMALVYHVILLIEGFREHIAWGLGMLFFPVVTWVFLFVCWDVAARPFFRSLLGGLIMFCGAAMASASGG